MKTKFKILRYFLIELLFTVFVILYLYYIKKQLSPVDSLYENDLFTIIVLFAIFLIWFIGPMLNRYVLLIYSGSLSLYLISQTIYLRAFHQYYRFNTARDLLSEVWGERASAYEFIQKGDFLPLVILLIVTIIFVLLYFLFQRRCFKLVYRLPYKFAMLLLFIPIVNTLNSYENKLEESRHTIDPFQYYKTDAYIYEIIPNNNQFVEKFGLIPFAYRDAQTLFLTRDFNENDYEEIEGFLSQLPDHNLNEMTGIFAGKSLIVIQAESYNNIVLDPDLTPTIYKMATEGINVKNFDTPALPGSTSDTEFMANTSIIPKSEGHASCYTYPYNSYLTTLPNLFNEHGYKTTLVHNLSGNYYNRNVIFPNLGYQRTMFCPDFGYDGNPSDKQIMDVLEWVYVERSKPYFEYWITYSGHQPYEYDSVGVEDEYVERIKNKYPNASESTIAYLAKNMDLDTALGELIYYLQLYEKLDDVVFVFFGDHIVKGIDYSKEASIYKELDKQYDVSYSYTDLYIYNSATEGFQYDKIGTSLDLLPTIANLWGFEYNSHTVLGRDIFDPEYEGFFFSEWNAWHTPHYYYDPATLTFKNMEAGYSEEQARKEISYYTKMMEISSKILKYDYFAKVK